MGTTMDDNIFKAISFITTWMYDLKRIDESTKIDHCMRVYENTARIPGVTEEMKIAAILHDVVEDTEASLTLIEELFGERVRELVDALSRRTDETYVEFIQRICEDPQAMLVKKADICDNLSTLELNHGLVKRYIAALHSLSTKAIYG